MPLRVLTRRCHSAARSSFHTSSRFNKHKGSDKYTTGLFGADKEIYHPSRPDIHGFFSDPADMLVRPSRFPQLTRSVEPVPKSWKRQERAYRFAQMEEIEAEGVEREKGVLNPVVHALRVFAPEQRAETRKLEYSWQLKHKEKDDDEPSSPPPSSPTAASSASSKPASSSPRSSPRPNSSRPPLPAPRFSRGVRTGDAFGLQHPRPPGSGSRSFSSAFLPTSHLSTSLQRFSAYTISPSLAALPRSFSSSSAFAYPTADAATAEKTSTRTLPSENKVAELASKVPADQKIDLRQIMWDLRDLELLELLRKQKPKSGTGYKDAQRTLYLLFHKLDEGEIKHVTFGQVHEALSSLYTLPWTAIGERLLENKVHKLDQLSVKQKAEVLFMQLYSVGPTRAERFAEARCRTFEDLEKRTDKLKLTKAQRIGLKHREDIQRLIPRFEMEKLKLVLEKALQAIDPRFECEILGSYRRGVDFSSDVDLVVRHPEFVEKDDEGTAKPMMEAIIRKLEKIKLIEEENQLMFGWKKYAGLVRLPKHKHYRRIDLRLCPAPSFPYLLLGCTGDSMLMKLLRHTAKKKGMCLNEYGMGDKYDAEDENPNGFKPGTLRVVKTEREIFDLLGLPYLEPKDRELRIWEDIYRRGGVRGMDYLHRL
ncbi:hypothetical protein JCM8097_002135 [Rhodosporidiobolus ruineniae]